MRNYADKRERELSSVTALCIFLTGQNVGLLLEVKLPHDRVYPSVGWPVGWFVIIFLTGLEFHFHTPIGALV